MVVSVLSDQVLTLYPFMVVVQLLPSVRPSQPYFLPEKGYDNISERNAVPPLTQTALLSSPGLAWQ